MEYTSKITQIAYKIVAPLIISFGITGNILNLLVLLIKPFLKGGTRVYLTALAISDLSVMLTVIPMIIRWNNIQPKTFEFAFYHAHLELFFNNTFIASSVFIIVCLTAERYFSVCLPTVFRSAQTVKIAKIATVGCYLLAVLISVPLIFLKTTCPVVTNESNTCPQWDFHENGKITSTIYWNLYLWISELLVRFGPCVILAVLNILIIRKFRVIKKKRKMYKQFLTQRNNIPMVEYTGFKKEVKNKKYQEEKRLITLLRSIVILFFVTMTPSAILSLAYSEVKEHEFSFQVFRAVANVLELSNFGSNFYIYFFCSKEFRLVLSQFLRRCFACREYVYREESAQTELIKMKKMLNVVKLSETSDLNSTEEQISAEKRK